MQLRRACELFSDAHAAGESVEQALSVSRFALKRLYVNGVAVWEIRENERLLTATDDAGLHQLAGEVLAAELRRQGV